MESLYVHQGSHVSSEIKGDGLKSKMVVENDGVKIYIEGIKYPLKGFSTPQTMEAVNVVKRITIELLKLLKIANVWSVWIPFKTNSLVELYIRMCYPSISPFFIVEKFRQPITREINLFISTFMIELGVTNDSSLKIADIVSHIFEFDTAYRFRLQDIAKEVDTFRLRHYPRMEVRRVMDIWIEREAPTGEYIRSKLRILKWVFIIILSFPKMYKAFMTAVQTVDITKMYPDEADIYWMKQRHDYLFNFND